MTRIIAHFRDYAGKYPWHCHILEHEDNEMMLQFEVVGSDTTVVLGSLFAQFQTEGQALNLLQGNIVVPGLQNAAKALKNRNTAGALSLLTSAQGQVAQAQALVTQMRSLRDSIAQVLGQTQLGKSATKIAQQLDKALNALFDLATQLAGCAQQIASAIDLLSRNDPSLLSGALRDAKLAIQSCQQAAKSLKAATSAMEAVQQAAQKAGIPLAKGIPNESVVHVEGEWITLRLPSGGEFQLYDLSGKRVLTLKGNASGVMTVPARTESGVPLANGVYLYLVSVRGNDGKIVRSEVKKLVILK